MSSLLGEVVSNLTVDYVFKSGEQVYFKTKTVYLDPVTESKTSELKSNNHDSKPNKLKAGIAAVKKAVDDALIGTENFTDTNSQLEALRKEIAIVKEENQQFRKELDQLRQMLEKISLSTTKAETKVTEPASTATADADDFDLFDSDDEEETEEHKRIREERLAAYAAKKLKKPGPIAKSSVILDVKPWDDETDMELLEKNVRSIELDGLLWGSSKLIEIGYGIKKLQIILTVEDDKVSVDNDIIERIQDEFSDYVQSVDIVAFNKI